ncbi:DUF6152 family protein [Hydrocarboniphaga sp.]|uniref:DUF6152 family protein n=1 Tax=Hydrocarboniphaga sp. TaxID=2033016 RepID=UPI003D0CD152
MLRKLLLAAAVAGGTLFGVAAEAHHSFALYDLAKLNTVVGTVREWKWANPHCYLVIEVLKADGTSEQWTLSGSSPNMMSRWGWNAADLVVGEKVTVDIHPARDGRHFASMQTVFLPDGKALVDPAGQPGAALAAGPTNVPKTPQGVPYK